MSWDVDALMNEVGPMDEAIDGVVRLPDGRYVVSLDEVAVEVEFHAPTKRLLFSTVVGPLPLHRAADVATTLLAYNALRDETGGVCMGLTAREGEVLQMTDLFAPDADPRTVVTVLRNLAERTLIWRSFLDASDRDLDVDGPPPVDEHLIRV